ncbi:MAG: polyprenyl synthetase family protein [Candidatus Syntrophoarchaeum sp.]|nr:polyprenyl synthetase family protein [Candidatus Syntrophoarchaeum sp.]
MNPCEWEEKQLIENRLYRILDEIDDWPHNREIMQYIIRSGGKRTRSIIVLLTCELTGGDARDAVDAAVAVEFSHIASLIHDDILDAGKMRHGIPTIYEKYGLDQAILIGDFLISNSIFLGSTYDEAVIKDLALATMNMAEGEILDTASRTDPYFDEDKYYDLIEKKTASLFSAAASIGGRIGGASEKEVLMLKEIGTKAGIAYQILDDLLEFLNLEIDKHSSDASVTLPLILNKTMEEEKVKFECIERIGTLVGGCMDLINAFPESPARKRLIQVIEYMTLEQLKDECYL